ncbi:hypothetical protein AAH994_02305 [Weeksellaceae bacterium A-14]
MKKPLFLFFFLIYCSSYIYAQENRFSAAERQSSNDTDFTSAQNKSANDDDDPGLPPNPNDPVPIDGGIPLLLISGVLIIGYFRYKTQKH